LRETKRKEDEKIHENTMEFEHSVFLMSQFNYQIHLAPVTGQEDPSYASMHFAVKLETWKDRN
jgi:hypothetical protein